MLVLFLLDLARIRYIPDLHARVHTFIYETLQIIRRRQQQTYTMDTIKSPQSLNQSSLNDALTSNMIVFQAGEKKYCYETNRANMVTVVGSTGSHDHGSSKVKLKNIVDYKWEVRNYPGRLLAVHIDGEHIAYAIKVNNPEGRSEGMVRVVNHTNSQRALIKGMSSEVLDLQFAHIKNLIILACVEDGALHIHRIDSGPDKITCTLLLKIEDSSPAEQGVPISVNRLSWCPYVPEKETDIDEYVSQQLVWIRGPTFRCYSIRSVINMYGAGSRMASSAVDGTLQHKEAANVTGAAFSPDGTTLCVSSEDGVIRFYQVYFHTTDTSPRCLHQWIPHGGKPVSGFFFLDNLTKYSLDKSLWRHAITTSDKNTELKVWCCSTWECLQTIRFASSVPGVDLHFNAQMDRTASYLVMSDVKNRGLYVLQVQLETSASPPRSQAKQPFSKQVHKSTSEITSSTAASDSVDETNMANPDKSMQFAAASATKDARTYVYIKSISEFPLSSPILSFGLVDAAVRKYKCAFNDSFLIDELEDYDEETHTLYCVVIHMFLVQPKSVQECHVLYQPTITEDSDVRSSICDFTEKAGLSTSNSGSISSANNDTNSFVAANNVVDDRVSADAAANLETLLKSPNFKMADAIAQLASKIQTTDTPATKTAPAAPINLMTPDSFQSPGRGTPDGVSSEVRSTLRMLAQAQSPGDIKRKSADAVNLLNLVSSKITDEPDPHQQALLRQSAELQQQILAPTSGASVLATAVAVTSGGSSPSREVQEILSLKDSDLNEFYDESSDLGDDMADEDENDGDSIGIKKNIDEQYNFNETCSKDNNGTSSKVSSLTNNNNNTNHNTSSVTNKGVDWPMVPQLAGVVGPTTGGLSNLHCASFNNIHTNATATNNSINDISNKLDQVLEFIQTQSCQISELRCCVDSADAKKSRAEETARMEQLSNKIEFNISTMCEKYFERCEREHKKQLDVIGAHREMTKREFGDHLVAGVSQLVCNQITDRLGSILLGELQRHILPTIAGSLDSIKTQILIDMDKRLVSNDQLLRETIAKVCSNKTTMEVFGNSITQGVQSSLQHVFTESVKVALIPAYEKASQDMFKQIQEAFINGTKSYTKLFENFSMQIEPLREHIKTQVPDQLKMNCEATLAAFSSQLTHDMQRELKTMQLHLLQSVRDNVKTEIRKGFESQAATIEDTVLTVVRSQAQTPAPSVFDVQEQIKNLLAQGQINSAFHQALVANDLQLVEFTIEKADYALVFNPCPLQQTVLLSLIQQISADMTNHNEIKQRYLSDSILNLNLRDPTTKEHAPKVMRELYHHCQKYAAANAASAHISGVRMLMMAVQGLGINIF